MEYKNTYSKWTQCRLKKYRSNKKTDIEKNRGQNCETIFNKCILSMNVDMSKLGFWGFGVFYANKGRGIERMS